MSARTPAIPRPSPFAQPAGLALCWYCDATADRIDPPGWVTVNPSPGPELTYATGICPACLVAYHSSPYSRGTS
ncbi:MAG TPA: hypothetical protein VM533_02320 [Fimbriiglobus sp.]|jgi:hypothetical protein|nr:hypothetical protein [Fimbriiglobus sp.]